MRDRQMGTVKQFSRPKTGKLNNLYPSGSRSAFLIALSVFHIPIEIAGEIVPRYAGGPQQLQHGFHPGQTNPPIGRMTL